MTESPKLFQLRWRGSLWQCQRRKQRDLPRKGAASRSPAAESMSEMAEVLFAPSFTEGGFTSRVIMVNGLSFAVNAQVILFDRSGHYGDS